jgi:hypothetical protein
MRTNREVKFWENIILSGKKIEPRTEKDAANYDIAEYLLQRETRAA